MDGGNRCIYSCSAPTFLLGHAGFFFFLTPTAPEKEAQALTSIS
ncbi:hypothetical protein SLEP1_g26552 [Rubroshorea leprosula]|uniref:Uncharacterized protein n=1 Tax=Rubroshorea leprosula TaxID=152421 RepID=A0AAV5JWQ3_9ROSI|nr:hypothetical protein SLEP1_g26552 [Rubroshorea leprosula]